jgi:polyisoprenoid-binding protein YceI
MPSYQIDPQHSGVHFKVRHMMISNVRGEFSKVSGSVEFDPPNLASARVEARIDASTISTREPARDLHLKSSDFLDVTRHPEITFESVSATALGQDAYAVEGQLTIRGVTRPVTLQVISLTPEIKDPAGQLRRGASAKARIDRRDFDLTWNAVLESGGFVVGEHVDITIDVELMRPPD